MHAGVLMKPIVMRSSDDHFDVVARVAEGVELDLAAVRARDRHLDAALGELVVAGGSSSAAQKPTGQPRVVETPGWRRRSARAWAWTRPGRPARDGQSRRWRSRRTSRLLLGCDQRLETILYRLVKKSTGDRRMRDAPRMKAKPTRRGCRAAPGARARPRVDEAILAAARAELAERGYARMSVDGVAARAGVSKPTVYLRHRTKAELATAAIASMRVQPRPAPTDDVRADLVAHLRLLRAGLERPTGWPCSARCWPRSTTRRSCWRSSASAWWRRAARAARRAGGGAGARRATGRGQRRGRGRTLWSGGLFARYLAGEALGGRFVATLVDTVLDGLLSADASPRARGR